MSKKTFLHSKVREKGAAARKRVEKSIEEKKRKKQPNFERKKTMKKTGKKYQNGQDKKRKMSRAEIAGSSPIQGTKTEKQRKR